MTSLRVLLLVLFPRIEFVYLIDLKVKSVREREIGQKGGKD
jgi:hypothetical protein